MLDNAFEKKSAPNSAKTAAGPRTYSEESGGLPEAGFGRSTAPEGQGKTLPLRGNFGPPDLDHVDIFRLLDELEELPEKAKKIGPALVGFDRDQFYYLVLKIRANLPDDVKKAQRVARDSERIVDEAREAAVHQLESGRVEAARALEDARSEAGRIVEQARHTAAAMVENSEVSRMATAQANEMLKRAETEASEIRKGADDYARDVLANLEAVMSKAIITVQRGRETLDKARCT